MSHPLRIVHYLNQFFGQIGGEDKADAPPVVTQGPVGPGLAFKAALAGQAEIVATIICGDNTMSDAPEKQAARIADMAAAFKPDLLIAGPAFGAGRYGMACGQVSAAVSSALGIPTLAGLHESNPAVDIFRSRAILVPTGPTAASMRAAVADISQVALELGRGQAPAAGTYFTQGIRMPVFHEQCAANRAADMLLARLRKSPTETELPLPSFEHVPPAPPLDNLSSSVIVMVTEGGLTPKGNPDRIEASMATKFGIYPVDKHSDLADGSYQASHGGYDNACVNADLNRLLPLDALRKLERDGVIGAIAPVFYTTAGNATTMNNAQQFGRSIAQDIRKRIHGQAGVFLTAT